MPAGLQRTDPSVPPPVRWTLVSPLARQAEAWRRVAAAFAPPRPVALASRPAGLHSLKEALARHSAGVESLRQASARVGSALAFRPAGLDSLKEALARHSAGVESFREAWARVGSAVDHRPGDPDSATEAIARLSAAAHPLDPDTGEAALALFRELRRDPTLLDELKRLLAVVAASRHDRAREAHRQTVAEAVGPPARLRVESPEPVHGPPRRRPDVAPSSETVAELTACLVAPGAPHRDPLRRAA
jgi:hypothetical protein